MLHFTELSVKKTNLARGKQLQTILKLFPKHLLHDISRFS